MIGVDRMADLIEMSMRSASDRAYPPYDIEKTGDDAYRITIATAGFRPEDLEITAQPNLLVVTGRKDDADEARQFLHHGLAGRSFEHRFELADYVVVRAADYANGLLAIDLAREAPEAMRPRRIAIAAQPSGAKRRLLDSRPRRRAA
jgi:molecular chaperone IbpA